LIPFGERPSATARDNAAMHPTALIVTLQMDATAAAHFTELRRRHFPPQRNWLAAHVTLFHAVPLTVQDQVLSDVADLAGATDAFRMRVDRLLFLGGGVAYGITSEQATDLRRSLAARWDALLSRQDRAWHGRLHVTVQNKVEAPKARALHAELERDFAPWEIGATGLQVWHYVGGPWEAVASFPFADGSAARSPA
jgi:hypothetical protein